MGLSLLGDALYVNLTKGEVRRTSFCPEFAEKYIGGRGFNARLLFDMVTPQTEPLSPGSVLLFSVGTLVGTFAPGAAKMTVSGKSPVTGAYFKSVIGGHAPYDLKTLGIQSIVISGRSEEPVYLHICGEGVTIREANSVWGLGVRAADKALKEKHPGSRVILIGPAGENLVSMASVMSSVYRSASRGGLGAVMGSKGLKAIVVQGTEAAFEVSRPEEFAKVALATRQRVMDDLNRMYRYHIFGTQRGLGPANSAGLNPSRNFRSGWIEGGFRLGGEPLREKFVVRETGCTSCVLGCGKIYEIPSGAWKGSFSGGPQWESANSLGARVGLTNPEVMLKANEICNDLGLDACSVGSCIAWAMEGFEKGIITEKDTDGLRLEWGNPEALLQLIHDIGRRRGFGEILARGVKGAAEIIGGGSDYFAVQNRGLDATAVDVRVSLPYALAFAVNPRGPDHLHSELICQFGGCPEHVAMAEKISGCPEGADRLSPIGKARMLKYHEQVVVASDSLGICFFHSLSSHRVSPESMSEMLSAAFGKEIRVEDLLTAGERILNLERAFNVREGLRRKDDTLPRRFLEEAVEGGPTKGIRLIPETLREMIDEYYALHGWDDDGIPKESTLRMLGLEDLDLSC